jgi:hypothetical protein
VKKSLPNTVIELETFNNVSTVFIIQNANIKIECRETWTPTNSKVRSGVMKEESSSADRSHTPCALTLYQEIRNYPISKISISTLGKRKKPQSKLVCQDQVTEQSADKINVSKRGQWNNPISMSKMFQIAIFIWVISTHEV